MRILAGWFAGVALVLLGLLLMVSGVFGLGTMLRVLSDIELLARDLGRALPENLT